MTEPDRVGAGYQSTTCHRDRECDCIGRATHTTKIWASQCDGGVFDVYPRAAIDVYPSTTVVAITERFITQVVNL
jgi:hypothetical protein